MYYSTVPCAKCPNKSKVWLQKTPGTYLRKLTNKTIFENNNLLCPGFFFYYYLPIYVQQLICSNSKSLA